MKYLSSLGLDANKIVVDLNKVHYAALYWRNQENNVIRNTKPDARYSQFVNGSYLEGVNEYALPYDIKYPSETRYERAVRLDIIDKWTPVLILQLGSNHKLTFEGPKAESLWAAWCSKQFNNKNKNDKRTNK